MNKEGDSDELFDYSLNMLLNSIFNRNDAFSCRGEKNIRAERWTERQHCCPGKENRPMKKFWNWPEQDGERILHLNGTIAEESW